jgi:hypothetical protein
MTLHTKCSRGSNNQEIYIETCVEYGDIVDVFSINFPCCALTTSPHLTQEVSCLTREDFPSSSEGFLCYLTREDLTREDFLPHKRGLSSSQERAGAFSGRSDLLCSLSLSHVHPSRRSRTQAYSTDVSECFLFRVCQ